MSNIPSIKVERIHLLDGPGHLKAYCDLLILESFIVKGFRVVQGRDNVFVSMPQSQGKDGKWYDTFCPLSIEMRNSLHELVLEAYKTQLKPANNRTVNDMA